MGYRYIEVAELGKEDVVIYDVKSLSEVYKQSANRASVVEDFHPLMLYCDYRMSGGPASTAAELVSVQKWIK